ncbi:hypothetical protein A6280_10600 [Bacillus wiedmannii]|nr:hypothetical protein A6280_10600 [Bacillus wiedmannii]
MGVMRQVIDLLKSATKEQWMNTVEWLLYTLIGGLLPLWLGAIILKLLSNWNGWDFFVVNGEFALYSASLLAPTIHILVKDTKKPGFKLLILFSIVFLVVSTALYTTVTVKATDETPTNHQIQQVDNGSQVGSQHQNKQEHIAPKESKEINIQVLKWISVLIFIFTIILSFLATLLENVKSAPNVEGIKAREMNDLEESFKNL